MQMSEYVVFTFTYRVCYLLLSDSQHIKVYLTFLLSCFCLLLLFPLIFPLTPTSQDRWLPIQRFLSTVHFVFAQAGFVGLLHFKIGPS